MDDIIVVGCSEEHMINNLQEVFETCRRFNLKLHPDKCKFFCQDVTFLGHKCTSHGILPDSNKYNVIKDYPNPTNKDETKRFVAFCNCYRKFIRNFAVISKSLNNLSKKKVVFNWTEECYNSFNQLKDELINPPILQYPDFSISFYITTDASKLACGAVLSQKYNGTLLPIAFASRSFTQGESNKATIEQELLAIHWAINYFRPYVYGRKFIVQTDHRPLTYLFSMKNPSSKLTRVRLDLEEYDFEIEYVKGKDNVTADALSRITFDEIKINNVLLVSTRSAAKTLDSIKNCNNKSIQVYEEISARKAKRLPKIVTNNQGCLVQKAGKNLIAIDKKQYTTTNEEIYLDKFLQVLEKQASCNNIVEMQISLNDIIFKKVPLEEIKEKGNSFLK